MDGSRIKRDDHQQLTSDPEVLWSEVQVPKKRVKRDVVQYREDEPFSDPLYSKQWYLNGVGASNGFDMKIRRVWEMGFTGKGVVVSILDDGVQAAHPDLAENYDPLASKDINDNDDDPTPQNNGDNKHGTRCAGEVSAVAANNWCGVGVAFNSKIGGVRMLDGPVTDRVEASALSHNQNHIDIYSASWGPEDDGRAVDGPGSLAKAAFYHGVTEGRGGKGNIFVWASGNGGIYGDSCSCDGYTTSIYTLSVSSATSNNERPYYLEECPSTFTTTYSSGSAFEPAIVTTDMPDSCTIRHTGTSASAPIAAGIFALVLEANPKITWRDMQHLVVRTSNPTPLLQNSGWRKNGVGRYVSNKFGYGMIDAEALVKLAQRWMPLPEKYICTYNARMKVPRALPGIFSYNFTLNVGDCSDGTPVYFLEHVQVVVSASFSPRGDLKMFIVSPAGTRSEILPLRKSDRLRGSFNNWPFLSVQQWGENPRGVWTLIVESHSSSENSGYLDDWSLTLHATKVPAQPEDTASDVDAFDRVGGGGRRRPIPALHEVYFVRRAPVNVYFGEDINVGDGMTTPQPALHENCHSECDQNGCFTPNSSLECVRCLHFSQRLRSRGGTKCVAKCEAGYYVDAQNRRCLLCLKGCATCRNSENCDTCLPGLYLVTSDPKHLSGNRCQSDCPKGFNADTTDLKRLICQQVCAANCLTCDNPKACKLCKKGYYVTTEGACSKNCSEGLFPDISSGKCEKCSPNCIKCSDVNFCEVCKVDHVWDPKAKRCVFYGPVRQCEADIDCPDGEFCDTNKRTCSFCHPDCSKCTGPQFDQCTECSNGQVPSLRTHQCACKPGQYFDETLMVCQSCDPSCKLCTGPSAHECVKCALGLHLFESRCLKCCENERDARSHQCATCNGEGVLVKHTSVVFVVMCACIGSLTLYLLVFGLLMWRERSKYDRENVGAYSNYPYSKVPTECKFSRSNVSFGPNGIVQLATAAAATMQDDEDLNAFDGMETRG